MFRITLFIIFLSSAISEVVNGQTISEALRYGTYNYGSTARALGSGSAFGAIGADLSVASTNPAALSEFRKSEFAFSFDMSNAGTDATLSGASTVSNNENIFNLEQIGVVLHKRPIASNWNSNNLVITFNRLANFDENISYRGTTNGTITQRFVERANGRFLDELDDFEAGPAFDAGAIFDFDEDFLYESDFTDFNTSVFKGQEIERRGGIQEFSLSYAGSLKNKFSFGAGVGIPLISFDETKTYFEQDLDQTIDFFNELQFVETLQTTGIGINFRLGVMYKLTPKFRIGAAVHTPTSYSLTDDFTTDVVYNFTEGTTTQNLEAQSPEGNFEYRIKTPLRSMFSLGYLFKAGDIYGFVSSEVEMLNFGSSSFNLTKNPEFSDPELERDLNDQIDNSFRSAMNLRLGTEVIYKSLVVRAGANLNGNQLEIGDNSANVLSFGLGFKKRNFYLDLGYQKTSSAEEYSPYFLVDSASDQFVDIDKSFDRLRLTVGFKFD